MHFECMLTFFLLDKGVLFLFLFSYMLQIHLYLLTDGIYGNTKDPALHQTQADNVRNTLLPMSNAFLLVVYEFQILSTGQVGILLPGGGEFKTNKVFPHYAWLKSPMANLDLVYCNSTFYS